MDTRLRIAQTPVECQLVSPRVNNGKTASAQKWITESCPPVATSGTSTHGRFFALRCSAIDPMPSVLYNLQPIWRQSFADAWSSLVFFILPVTPLTPSSKPRNRHDEAPWCQSAAGPDTAGGLTIVRSIRIQPVWNRWPAQYSILGRGLSSDRHDPHTWRTKTAQQYHSGKIKEYQAKLIHTHAYIRAHNFLPSCRVSS